MFGRRLARELNLVDFAAPIALSGMDCFSFRIGLGMVRLSHLEVIPITSEAQTGPTTTPAGAAKHFAGIRRARNRNLENPQALDSASKKPNFADNKLTSGHSID